jgi:hypothetical protein
MVPCQSIFQSHQKSMSKKYLLHGQNMFKNIPLCSHSHVHQITFTHDNNSFEKAKHANEQIHKIGPSLMFLFKIL